MQVFVEAVSRGAFSVGAVIPTYNNPACLRRAIDSVLAQTRRPDEIVIVNDGSTDNTLDVVASYGERVRCVTQPNGGAAAARNRGVKELHTDWVAFLDQDDEWTPNKLAVQCAAIERTRGAAFSITGAEVYCGTERTGEVVRTLDSIRRLARVRNCFGSASAYMIHRDAFFALGGFRVEQATFAEDWELAFRLYQRYPICVVADKLLRYYVNAGSASSNGARMFDAELRMIDTTLTEDLHGLSRALMRRKLLAHAYYRLALNTLEVRARVTPLLRSLSSWPWIDEPRSRAVLLAHALFRG